MMKKIKDCWNGKVTPKGYMIMKWCIGFGQFKVGEVCRTSFLNSYNLPHASVERCCAAIKRGSMTYGDNFYNDKTNSVLNKTENGIKEKAIKLYMRTHNLTLSLDQITAYKIPNNELNLNAYGWMYHYFNLVGDIQPNKKNEIHLEPCTVTSVFIEYLNDLKLQCNLTGLSTEEEKTGKILYPHSILHRLQNFGNNFSHM